jgi:hypothetical protein
MKFDILERFEFIETQLYWGNGLTANELAEAFGLTRQTAQGIINAYKQRHPNTIHFDKSKKRQVANVNFKPYYIKDSANTFLNYLRGQTMSAYYCDSKNYVENYGSIFTDVDYLLKPNLDQSIIRIVTTALKQCQAIAVYYQSKNGYVKRIISPHHLIFAAGRYHIRAYCHLTKHFLDFVLSRIINIEPTSTIWVSPDNDIAWHNFVKLYFIPNPDLSAEVIAGLKCDYKLDHKEAMNITCRIPIEFYIKRKLLSIEQKYNMPLWKEIIAY